MVNAWPRANEARAEPGLYEAAAAGLHAIVRALPDAAPSVMLVGHNPSLADLANHLAGSGATSDVARMAAKFPTAGLAVLEFDIDRWRDAAPGSARLARFVTPDDTALERRTPSRGGTSRASLRRLRPQPLLHRRQRLRRLGAVGAAGLGHVGAPAAALAA